MYFTQTSIRNDQVVTMSEYISTRLIRKGDITSYYVGRCLTHVAEPTVVNTICFIKQTIIKQTCQDPFYLIQKAKRQQEAKQLQKKQKGQKKQSKKQSNIEQKKESKLQKYRRLYYNQIKVHEYVAREVNFSTKYYSQLLDYWHDTEGLNHKFTIVTKYQDYGDLNHFIEYIKDQKIQLNDTQVIYILNNMLKASLELYKIGVIHRDIKPENIFIDQFFQIKFGDFGISLMDEVGKNPYSNQVVGTYGFMAPEIFHEPYYSYSVDVWAIGVVTYYLMYLAYPYGRERQNYKEKVKGRLKDIENASAYSDKFSKRLKDFMRRLFDKNPMNREKAIVLYEYEYMHEFRTIDVTLKLRKKYESYIKKVNQCNTLQIQRFALQQHSLYHQKILQVVRYEQWGYFFLLSNLKVIGLFNSKPDQKIIRVFPDCLDDVKYYKQDLYCTIISQVDKHHFHNFKLHLQTTRKVYSKRINCTIDNIVQYGDTLAVRLKLNPSQASKKQLKQKQDDPLLRIDPKYQRWKPNSANKDPLDYYNHTLQIFFFPQQLQSQFEKIKYTTYGSSIIFNNNMTKKEEVLISKIDSRQKQKQASNYYQMKKYPNPQSILYSDDQDHRHMLQHAKKLFTFVAIKKIEEEPATVSFLQRYHINDN